jgi:hypothetical protein
MPCPSPAPFAFTPVVQPGSTVTQTPPAGFDAATALVLGNACLLTYDQFAAGVPALTADQLAQLGSDFVQVGSGFTLSESIAAGTTIGSTGGYATVMAGFAARGTVNGATANVIALRGTRTYGEWIDDVEAIPGAFHVGTNAGNGYSVSDPPYGMVHGGFYNLYNVGTDGAQPEVVSGFFDPEYSRPDGSLAQQIEALVASDQWDATLPLYVTGHSLGAALAELCAMDVAVNFPGAFPAGGMSVYSLAGPLLAAGFSLSVLDFAASKFADAYNGLVPNTFRVVNAADVVPISPPTCLSLGELQVSFAQVAAAQNVVSFIAQSGSIGQNHSCADTYVPYLQQLAAGFPVAVTTANLRGIATAGAEG